MAARRRGATPRPSRRPRARTVRPRSVRPSGPGAARIVLYGLLGLIALVAADFLYQVIRKPTELFFPVSGVLYKTPTESWRAYGAVPALLNRSD